MSPPPECGEYENMAANKEWRQPEWIKLDVSKFMINSRYVDGEAIKRALDELMIYATTGEKPENPSPIFNDLFPLVEKCCLDYQETCKRNQKITAEREEKKRQKEANAQKNSEAKAKQDEQPDPTKDAQTDEQRQILEKAKYCGIPTSTDAEKRNAFDLLSTYGLTEVLTAIEIAGQQNKKTWAYIKGTLDNRRNGTSKLQQQNGKNSYITHPDSETEAAAKNAMNELLQMIEVNNDPLTTR